MWTIIIGAIINLIIWFIQQYWTNHPPVDPTPAKTAFLDHMGKVRYFWMGTDRKKYADKLFDKFTASYKAKPPVVTLSDKPLNSDLAKGLAKEYAHGLTLSPDEI